MCKVLLLQCECLQSNLRKYSFGRVRINSNFGNARINYEFEFNVVIIANTENFINEFSAAIRGETGKKNFIT